MTNKKFVKPKKDHSDLLKSEYVVKWIENFKSDKQSRLSILKQFCEFLGKTPTELIEEQYEDSIKKPLKRTHISKRQIISWFEHLKENGRSHNSARQYTFSKVASFYARNDVPVHFQKREVPKATKGKKDKVWRNAEGERISKDMKKHILKQIRDRMPTLRDKAIFLCKLSSGMDDVDLFNLKISDYEQGKFPKLSISYIEGNRQKSDEIYQTFFGVEACEIIDMYLKHRESKGEAVSNNSYLYISERLTNDKKPKRIKPTAFAESLRRVCLELNLKNITPKRLRSWFSTTLKRKGVEYDIVERMMGHTGEISKDYEDRFDDIEEWAEEYAEKIDPLVSLGNGNKRFTLLENEMNDLKDTIVNLSKENQEIKNQIKQINENNEIVKQALESMGIKPITITKKELENKIKRDK